MTFDIDPGDDFTDVTDGLASVVVTRPGASTSTVVPHALRRAVKTREVEQSGGRYTASDVTWHLPTSEVTVSPRLGDVIVDEDGGRWTVLDVQRAALGGRWRCVCRNLAIVHGLDQYVDVEKATYGKGPAGADEPAWHVWKTGLRAKIQPVGTHVTDQHDRFRAEARFVVFLAENLAVNHTHRIRGPDGTIYRIAGCRGADRIDGLMEIDVVQTD